MKKIELSGISTAPKSAKPTHVTIEADQETQTLLEQFALINPQYKTLKNQSETLGKQLAGRIKALFFNRFAGMSPDSSTMLALAGGRTIKLITKNAYSKTLTDDAGLIAALGQEIVSRHFQWATVLKLDLDKGPEAQREAFANGVIALAQSLGMTDAVSASQCVQPVAGFHEARTTLLTPQQNADLDALLPITAYAML